MCIRDRLLGSWWLQNFEFWKVYSWPKYINVSFEKFLINFKELNIWSYDPSKILPQPKEKSVSPVNNKFWTWKWNITWPLVWPGVWYVVNSKSLFWYNSLSLTKILIPGILSLSLLKPITLQLNLSFKSKFPPTWSPWWWVFSIYFKFNFSFKIMSIIGFDSPGSITQALLLSSFIRI